MVTLTAKDKNWRKAKKAAQKLAKFVTENAFSLVSATILDQSVVTDYVEASSGFHYYLYATFITMAFISLLVGCSASFLCDVVPDSDEMIAFLYTLSVAAAASVVLAMAVGLCLILPECPAGILVLICFTTGVWAYKMDLHAFMINVQAAKEKRGQRKLNEADHKLAMEVISTALTIISAMVLGPSNMVDYPETMTLFRYYHYIVFTMVTFISLIAGLLLLLLSNKEAKCDEMMSIQNKLRLAAIASLLLAGAFGLSLVVREVLIGLGIVCFLVFIFRQQIKLHIFMQG